MTVIRNLTRNVIVYILVLCCLRLLTSTRFLGSLINAKFPSFQIWWPFSSIMILSIFLPEEENTSCRKRRRLSPYRIAESDLNVSWTFLPFFHAHSSVWHYLTSVCYWERGTPTGAPVYWCRRSSIHSGLRDPHWFRCSKQAEAQHSDTQRDVRWLGGCLSVILQVCDQIPSICICDTLSYIPIMHHVSRYPDVSVLGR